MFPASYLTWGGQDSQLVGVTATSASNAWAVGSGLGATVVQH